MKRAMYMLYAIVAYVLFFASFLYAIGFVGNFLVPRSLDNGPAAPLGTALLIDAALLGVFALQHSVMARQGFKKWWTNIVPKPIERSTYVVFASLALFLLYWQWRPIGGTIWEVGGLARSVLIGLSLAGWAIVVIGTFIINHWDLFGLRQVWLYATGRPYTHPEFTQRGFYKLLRHPLMLGFIIAFWATPKMTTGHLVFAVATTAYILVALQLEERDLVHFHGEAYRNYQRQVRMLLPIPKRGSSDAASDSVAPAER
jgi:protein-S-isoprenylcysteine O-methyltransferase Ste14